MPAGKRPRFPCPTSNVKRSMTSARLAGWSNPTQPAPTRPGAAQTPWSIQRLVSTAHSTARTCCCSAAESPVTSARRQTVCLSLYSIAADISSSSSSRRVSRQRRRTAADTNLRPPLARVLLAFTQSQIDAAAQRHHWTEYSLSFNKHSRNQRCQVTKQNNVVSFYSYLLLSHYSQRRFRTNPTQGLM